MDSKELYEKLKELWEEFEDNHEKSKKVIKQQVVEQESP